MLQFYLYRYYMLTSALIPSSCLCGPGSADRKELLACLLYVLQNSPDRLLRGLWRHILSEQETLDDETANTMVRQGFRCHISMP